MNINKNAYKLTCQIKHDMISGVLGGWKKIIPFVLLIISFCTYLYIECANMKDIGYVDGVPTIADMLLYIFRGMREYMPELDYSFDIPITWLLMQVYIAYVIGNYASKDLGGYGQQFLLRSTKKSYWFLSKCVYCLVNILAYYITTFIIVTICSILFGNISLELSADIGSTMSEIDVTLFSSMSFIFHIIVLPISTSLVVSLVQLLLSLYVKPILSFTFVVSYQALSAYKVSYFLIGNYSMALRCDPFLEDGVNGLFAIIIEIIMIVIIIPFGCITLRKYDYLEKN